MKRCIIMMDEEKDKDIVDMLKLIPKTHRGLYIKEALRLGIDEGKDADIHQGLPNLAKPCYRHELVKEGLRQLIKVKKGKTVISNDTDDELAAFTTT